MGYVIQEVQRWLPGMFAYKGSLYKGRNPEQDCILHQVSYCEEKVDCRRVMIMGHFGERTFTQRLCNKTCDNCQNGGGLEHESKDVSQAGLLLPFFKPFLP